MHLILAVGCIGRIPATCKVHPAVPLVTSSILTDTLEYTHWYLCVYFVVPLSILAGICGGTLEYNLKCSPMWPASLCVGSCNAHSSPLPARIKKYYQLPSHKKLLSKLKTWFLIFASDKWQSREWQFVLQFWPALHCIALQCRRSIVECALLILLNILNTRKNACTLSPNLCFSLWFLSSMHLVFVTHRWKTGIFIFLFLFSINKYLHL